MEQYHYLLLAAAVEERAAVLAVLAEWAELEQLPVEAVAAPAVREPLLAVQVELVAQQVVREQQVLQVLRQVVLEQQAQRVLLQVPQVQQVQVPVLQVQQVLRQVVLAELVRQQAVLA